MICTETSPHTVVSVEVATQNIFLNLEKINFPFACGERVY